MNLLLFNLATDADDPILNFTTGWINRLATHYERIDVITMRMGRLAVAPNVCVYSVGKEHGYSEARRSVEFYRILSRLLSERRYAACFAHMMPLFAAMGAPLLRARGIPITLWYTHRQGGKTLRLATTLSNRIVTAAPDSFPFKTDKLRVLGHGIDTDFFAPAAYNPQSGDRATIVHVARLMPIKNQEALIRVLPDNPGMQAIFVGDVPPGIDVSYRQKLEVLARDLGVADRVTFAGNLPPEGVRDWYQRATAAVNLSPVGLFDKAALESMAVGVPTIVTNAAFNPLLGAYVERLYAETLDEVAPRLRELAALPEAERCAIGAALREKVVEQHSLDGLIGRLVSVLNTGEAA